MSSTRFSPQPKPNFTADKVAKIRESEAAYKELSKQVKKIHGSGCWNRRCISAMLNRPIVAHMEHILPRGREGRIDTIENLIPLCNLCNNATADGVKAAVYGVEMSGDEVKLMILRQHEKEPGFIHKEEVLYLEKMVEKQKMERGMTCNELNRDREAE